MKRPTFLTKLFIRKGMAAKMAVFLFCLLCGYGYAVNMLDKVDEVIQNSSVENTDSETKKDYKQKRGEQNTVYEEQDKSKDADVKLIRSYRSIYRAYALKDPFEEKYTSKEELEEKKKSADHEVRLKVSEEKSPSRPTHYQSMHQIKNPSKPVIRGIIQGETTLVLIDQGLYGIGEGPSGYCIEKIGKDYVIWRGPLGEETVNL